jgi:Co/Zn/Cd efflux system component
MPALGIGALLFGVAQAIISWYVYSEAKDHGLHPPVVPALILFVLGVLAVLVLEGVVGVIILELLLIALYVVAQSLKSRASSA